MTHLLLMAAGMSTLLTVAWLSGCAWAPSRSFLSRPPARQQVERITATVPVAFGLRVAAAER